MSTKLRKLDKHGLHLQLINNQYIHCITIGIHCPCIIGSSSMIGHNPDGPAYMSWSDYVDNKTNKTMRYKSLEIWRINGVAHRETDDPARTEFNQYGMVRVENYYKNGQIHREFGPAIIHYRHGIVTAMQYYIKGKQIVERRIDDFCMRWDLSDLASMKSNKAAHTAFIMEFYEC